MDHQKFPDGLRAFTDKIRETGLRPAVWIGGFCPKYTPIYKVIRSGSSITITAWTPPRRWTSASLKSAPTSNTRWMYFFRDYAFEGMKHDFWSYAFEDSHDLLKNKDASGYEWRTWWLKEIRKRIPADAYLQTGCDIVMGNPFLGEYFTNYRYGSTSEAETGIMSRPFPVGRGMFRNSYQRSFRAEQRLGRALSRTQRHGGDVLPELLPRLAYHG